MASLVLRPAPHDIMVARAAGARARRCADAAGLRQGLRLGVVADPSDKRVPEVAARAALGTQLRMLKAQHPGVRPYGSAPGADPNETSKRLDDRSTWCRFQRFAENRDCTRSRITLRRSAVTRSTRTAARAWQHPRVSGICFAAECSSVPINFANGRAAERGVSNQSAADLHRRGF